MVRNGKLYSVQDHIIKVTSTPEHTAALVSLLTIADVLLLAWHHRFPWKRDVLALPPHSQQVGLQQFLCFVILVLDPVSKTGASVSRAWPHAYKASTWLSRFTNGQWTLKM